MSRPPTESRFRSDRRICPVVARWIVQPVGIALLMAGGGDTQAAWTRGVQPAQPPTTAAGPQTPAGTPGGRIPAPQPVDADAASDTPTRPAATDAAVVFDLAQFVGPPEPPWLYGPPAPGIEEIADGLYVVSGYGGNVVARVTAEGVVVAGELTPAADTIAALVAGVTDQPVSYLLRTHRHEDGSAAVPAVWRNARLVALERMPRASGAGVRVQPEPPDLTFTRGLSLFPGEAEVQLRHFAPAHTAGDATVPLPRSGRAVRRGAGGPRHTLHRLRGGRQQPRLGRIAGRHSRSRLRDRRSGRRAAPDEARRAGVPRSLRHAADAHDAVPAPRRGA